MNEQKPEEIEEVNLTENKTDDLEVVDLGNQKVENTLETRKENRILFIIIGSLIVFALLLPTITRIFTKTSIFSYSSEVEDITSKGTTAEGLLEIGSDNEGSITVKNIQFYSFRKESNNTVSVVYLPGNSISKVEEENIYIELYNNKKNAIYRTKFIVNSKLERKIRGTYLMPVNENIYGEATYGKVVILNSKDFNIESSSLTCTLEEENTEYILTTNVKYNFSTNGLTNYIVTKTREEKIDENNFETVDNNETIEETEEITTIFDEEIEKIKDYVTNLEYDKNNLSYKVDLINRQLDETIYSLGSTTRQVKLDSEKNNWSCK